MTADAEARRVEALPHQHEPEIRYAADGDPYQGCACGWDEWANPDEVWSDHLASRGMHLVHVDDVARRLWEKQVPSHLHDEDGYRAEARRLLGVE